MSKNRVKTSRSKTLSATPSTSSKPSNKRSCGLRHTNKKIDGIKPSKDGYQCNDCKHKISINSYIYGCRICKFYICKICIKKPACNKGHKLKCKKIIKETQCNQCSCKLTTKNIEECKNENGIEVYYCKKCNYSVCLGCGTSEICPGNHGLKWKQIDKTTKKWSQTCQKCGRIYKLNKKVMMCIKCKYSICIDCYEPKKQIKIKYKTKGNDLNEKELNEFEKNDLALKKITEKYFDNENEIENENESKNENDNNNNDDKESEVSAPTILHKIPSVLTECIICMENDKDIAFIPCGHYVCCNICADNLFKMQASCPVCDKKIFDLIKIFN